ncbi:MAG: permease-like cell division protein FtsX [Chloroflexota bacterium]
MRTSTVSYIFSEAGRGVRRNRNLSLVSMTTVGVCLILLAIVVLLALNFDAKASELESQVTIKAYLKAGTSADAVTGLKQAISGIGGVSEVTFINKDQALQELRGWLQEDPVLEGVAELNVLRESFRVRVERPDQVEAAASAIKALDGVEEVDYRQSDVEKLFSVTRAIRIFGIALVALLSLGTVFLVSNTIRITIFARRREIGIMKLVGATDWFIRWPFIVEGTLIGAVGALLALIVVWSGYWWLAGYTARMLPFLAMIPPFRVLPGVSLLMVAVGLLVGVLGSSLSLRRFLRI